ncbi:MAG: PEP-CTERM sorting domain-containing protein [bacterium]
MRRAIDTRAVSKTFVQRTKGLVLLSLALTTALMAIPASASMIMSGASIFEPFSFSGEGNSYTHYNTPGLPASGPTGSSQEYFLTSTAPAFFIPDPQNYGLQISKGFLASFPGVTAWDGGVSLGEFDWALSYYDPNPASTGSPFHSVLYGFITNEALAFDPANDGPGGIQDIAYGSATLNYDGIYHSVSSGPIVFNPGPSTLDLTVTLYEVGLNASGQNEWSTVPIPEPSTALLVGLGLTGLAGKGRRRNRS